MSYATTERSGAAGRGYQHIPDDLYRLNNLDDYQVADDEVDPRGWKLYDRNHDEIGKIEDLIVSPSAGKAYFAVIDAGGWMNSRKFAVPLEQVRFNDDDSEASSPYLKEQFKNAPAYEESRPDYRGYYGYWSGYHQPVQATEANRTPTAPRERVEERAGEVRVPLADETAEVRRGRREVGFVTVSKRVETEHKHIAEPVTRTRVEVETREVSPDEAASLDTSPIGAGQTLRVPITEESVTVEKTPRVTREVILRTHPETECHEEDVELRHERVEVQKEGDVEMDEEPATTHRR